MPRQPADLPEPPANPGDPADPAAPAPKELRIAVAMRGGVSLAVWMGGVCAELVRLRNARPGGVDPYSQLLDILGYDKITVDVISGSSAGGLNGALLALNLAYGMPFGAQVRDLWLRMGDLEQLTRSPAARRPDSVLRGDEDTGFYGRLCHACHELLAKAPLVFRPARNIRLVLTATRLCPRTVRVRQTLGEPLHASRARAHFQFQHRAVDGAEPILTDFPADSPRSVSDWLAYAARTTSSFPGAFAPARIVVADTADSGDFRDFRGASSETGAGDGGGGSAELIDGGVLDNIPVAWAAQAIAGAPADRPVDRWLVYLQPVEPLAGSAGTAGARVPADQRRVSRLLRMLLMTVSRRMDSESLLDDAEEMRAAEATAQHLRGMAAAGIPSDPDQVLDDPARITAYRHLVGLAEGARLARLIQDPATLLGPDPLPFPPDRPLEGMRDAEAVLRGLAEPTTVAALALGGATPENAGPGATGSGIASGAAHTPFALGRTVSLLLDWVRAAESGGQLRTAVAAPLRDQLYSARLAVELLAATRDRIVLARLNDVAHAADVVDLARRATWRLAEATPAGWPIPDAQSWPAWRDRLLDLLPRPLPQQAPRGWPDMVFAPFWDQLAALGVSIAAALDPDVPGPVGFGPLRASVGHAGKAERIDAMRRALASAELLMGPVRTDPFSEPTDVKFHAITASRANPIEKLIFGRTLTAKQRVEAKLSGNQLHNFAAFLSARWRQADWTWGRLDAVPSLVQLLLADTVRVRERLAARSPHELAAQLGSHAAAAAESAAGVNRERVARLLTNRLQRDVLSEELPVLGKLQSRGADADLPPTPDDLASLPPADVDNDAPTLAKVGSETLQNLLRRAHVRRAATRVGLVGWRAVQPAGDGVLARLARLAFGLLKPLLLTPILAAISSPLGALIASLGAWLLVAAVAGAWSHPLMQPVLATGFAVMAGIAVWRLGRAGGWTATVAAAAGAAFCVLGGWLLTALGLNQLWDSALWRYGGAMLGALTAIVPFWWLLVSRRAGVRVLAAMLLSLSLVGALGAVLAALAMLAALPAVGFGEGASGWSLGAAGWLSAPVRGLLVLYAVLAVPTMLLTWLFPPPPDSATPDAASDAGPDADSSVT